MTSSANAGDRLGASHVPGNYAASTHYSASLTTLRPSLTAPNLGDAFADVFRSIASTPPPTAAYPEDSAPAPEPLDDDPPPLDNEDTSRDELSSEKPSSAAPSNDKPSSAALSSEELTPMEGAEQSLSSSDEELKITAPTTDAEVASEAAMGDAEPSLAPPDATDPSSEAIDDDEANAAADGLADASPGAEDPQPELSPLSSRHTQEQVAVPAAQSDGTAEDVLSLTRALSPQAKQPGAAPATAATAAPLVAAQAAADGANGAEPDETETAKYAGDTDAPGEGEQRVSKRRDSQQRRADHLTDQAASPLHDEASQETQQRAAASVKASKLQSAIAADSAAADGERAGSAGPESPSASPASPTIVSSMTARPPLAAAASPSLASGSLANASPSNATSTDSASAARSGNLQAGTATTKTAADAPSAAAAKDTADGPRVADRALLVQRVSRAFQKIGHDGGQVRIRLHPEELGGVQLQMRVQGQQISARMIAETEAARSVLTEHLPELRQRLTEQGMQVERLEIQLEGEQDAAAAWDSAGQSRAGQGDHQPQSGARQQRQRGETSAASIDRSAEASPRGITNARSVMEAARRKSVDLIG